jgi:hypothetical protein
MAKRKKYIRLSKKKVKYLGLEPKPRLADGSNARYDLSDEQVQQLYNGFNYEGAPRTREMVETQVRYDKDGERSSSIEKLQSDPIEIPENFKLIGITTNQSTGQQWLRHVPRDVIVEESEFDFAKIIGKLVKPWKGFPKKSKHYGKNPFDRLVYTDAHIGMDPNIDGYSLYGGKWDEEEITRRCAVIAEHVLEYKSSNVLVIDELGDFLDGYHGQTTRKGHELPQSLSTEEAFDIALNFKIRLIDALAPFYEKIICHNICNDNHAGTFGYLCNSSFKTYIELKYSHVKVKNYRKFIEHYVFGKNCFILTHGKDGKNLKFGFKPVLDPKQVEKIENYINEHKLHDYDVEFSKGDSHQKLFDESTADGFNYFNYPALSPSSDWVQTNFKKGMSGFEFFNFRKDGQKDHHPFKFKWTTSPEVIVDYAE